MEDAEPTILDLHDLQRFAKQDPDGYKEEFLAQKSHFEARVELFKANDQHTSSDLINLVRFIAQMATVYKEYTREIYDALLSLSTERSQTMHPDVRLAIVQSLGLIHNRECMTQDDFLTLMPHFFDLYAIEDKGLRQATYNFILRRIQRKYSNSTAVLTHVIHSVNRDELSIARTSIRLLIDLYKKKVYEGNRLANLVNAIAEACFHREEVMVREALAFFSDQDKLAEEKDTLDIERGITGLAHQIQRELLTIQKATKNKKKRERKIEAMQAQLERKKRTANPQETDETIRHTNNAIALLRDSESFAERLVTVTLARSKLKLKTRLATLRLLSLVIAQDGLFIEEFFVYIERYVKARQSEVTMVMAVLSQAVNPEAPAALQPIVRKIANEFIQEGMRTEFPTIGLNTIREIASRQPLVFDEDNKELLQELVEYRRHKDKGVSSAAGGLLSFYRMVNPAILPGNMRGRQAAFEERHGMIEGVQFGRMAKPATNLEGADMLDPEKPEEAGEGAGWGVYSDSDSDSDVWVEEAPDEEDVKAYEAEQEAARQRGEAEETGPRADTVRILTDDDFRRLDEIKAQRTVMELGKSVGVEVDPERLLANAKHVRMSKEEMVAHSKDNLPTEHGSSRGKNKGGGSSNQAKIKNKNQVMIAHSERVKNKQFRSARVKRLVADKHADWQRRKYKPKTR
ncbi:hypothetical protein J8273_3238 [Carpediemonas membranifera]|uniref:Protein SDA1 n=1 Tax=Carpediemonas membranifera TaxID=201153 RepID=A0A8J6B2W4_9EUKA|nr:hypothetical protein J8273_3238 [Carpediemonas membranifera]|eukprot:KAG9393109.1 hypothetical protein J8273_3238 [Carpediemonas membranifera]